MIDNGLALVVVATITTVGGVIVALIQLLKKENREDHALVIDAIRSVYKSVGRVEDKVDKHLVWHAEGQNERISERSQKS